MEGWVGCRLAGRSKREQSGNYWTDFGHGMIFRGSHNRSSEASGCSCFLIHLQTYCGALSVRLQTLGKASEIWVFAPAVGF
jgi:hypothetical protein